MIQFSLDRTPSIFPTRQGIDQAYEYYAELAHELSQDAQKMGFTAKSEDHEKALTRLADIIDMKAKRDPREALSNYAFWAVHASQYRPLVKRFTEAWEKGLAEEIWKGPEGVTFATAHAAKIAKRIDDLFGGHHPIKDTALRVLKGLKTSGAEEPVRDDTRTTKRPNSGRNLTV